MGALSCSHLPVLVLCWNFLEGSASEGSQAKVEGSPWLQPQAVESVIEDLIHHFKPDGSTRESQFTKRLVKRIYAYQDDLRPIYNSLPKNEKGHLEMAEVGQALHRLFVRRYQMHLRGLASFGDSSGGLAPATKVEEFVQKAIQSGLVDKGFTNRELSIFAVAMEHLIHEESRGILARVFSLLNLGALPQGATIPKEKAKEVLDAYIVFLLARQDTSVAYEITSEVLAESRQRLEKEQSSLFTLCKQRLKIRLNSQNSFGAFDFDALLVIAEEFEQGLGATLQEAVCKARKKAVLSASTTCDNSGRVPLLALTSNSFVGSFEALDRQGILEASSGSKQMAYFANWMLSADNCQIKTDFYTVCCADPCEMILSKIEQLVAAPLLKVEHVVTLAPLLKGSHSKTEAELRDYMMKAVGDSGSVDIHGTGFADFLHYSVPCECPNVTKSLVYMPPSTTTPAGRQTEQQQQEKYSQEQQQKQQQASAQQDPSPVSKEVVAASPVSDEVVAERSFWHYGLYVLIPLLLALGLCWVFSVFHSVKRSALNPEYRKPRKVNYQCDMKSIV